MNQPDEQTGRGADQPGWSDEVAPATHGIDSWAPTIRRWTAAGWACFVVTGNDAGNDAGAGPATPGDVADATARLHENRPASGD